MNTAHTKETTVNAIAQFGVWNPMETAPKGGGADRIDDPNYVVPPRILLLFDNDERLICYWDAYYDEGGWGYEGCLAWVSKADGELASKYYGDPIAWMPLPLVTGAIKTFKKKGE